MFSVQNLFTPFSVHICIQSCRYALSAVQWGRQGKKFFNSLCLFFKGRSEWQIQFTQDVQCSHFPNQLLQRIWESFQLPLFNLGKRLTFQLQPSFSNNISLSYVFILLHAHLYLHLYVLVYTKCFIKYLLKKSPKHNFIISTLGMMHHSLTIALFLTITFSYC